MTYENNRDSNYARIFPDDHKIIVEALPKTRFDVFSTVTALVDSAPLPRIYQLVLQFTDPEYGFSEVKQFTLRYYLGQGWGIGASPMPRKHSKSLALTNTAFASMCRAIKLPKVMRRATSRCY